MPDFPPLFYFSYPIFSSPPIAYSHLPHIILKKNTPPKCESSNSKGHSTNYYYIWKMNSWTWT